MEPRTRWTVRLIPNFRPCAERKYREVEYYMSQLLFGHGYFRRYLHMMGKAESPDCLYSPGVTDPAEHIILSCGRWLTQRHLIVTELGQYDSKSLVGTMLRGLDTWKQLVHFIAVILKAKNVAFNASSYRAARSLKLLYGDCILYTINISAVILLTTKKNTDDIYYYVLCIN